MQKILQDLEKTREEFWNITKETGQFIYHLIVERGYRQILEIGTSNGYSGLWIASALKEVAERASDEASGAPKLYTIESHRKKRFYLAKENFEKSGLDEYIEQILGHAPEAIPKQPEKFDLAFFDATKYEHILYLKALQERINPGGMIITDNINSHREALDEYIAHVKSLKGWTSEEINIGTGLLIAYKSR